MYTMHRKFHPCCVQPPLHLTLDARITSKLYLPVGNTGPISIPLIRRIPWSNALLNQLRSPCCYDTRWNTTARGFACDFESYSTRDSSVPIILNQSWIIKSKLKKWLVENKVKFEWFPVETFVPSCYSWSAFRITLFPTVVITFRINYRSYGSKFIR